MYFYATKKELMEHKSIIFFQNVDIVQGEKTILSDVNFELYTAETIYIVGKSGSGKSSLLKTMYGSLPVQSGIAHVAGFNLLGLKEKDVPKLRRNLGMVFQDFLLFDEWTVGKNLLYVLEALGWKERPKITARVLEVLHLVGLSGFEKKLVKELSGGEQQRVVIARSLLNKPAIIIADEPTGNLDPETSDDILYLLNRLSKENGTSIIIATHDYRIIEKFPARMYHCHSGLLNKVN